MSPFSTRAAAQAPPPPRPAAAALDYEFFKTRVQPIFLAERPGHARCIACHGSGTPMRLQPLARRPRRGPTRSRARTSTWCGAWSCPASAKSRLLMHPLAEQAGGDFYHNGGKHWTSQNDPEWQTVESLGDGRDAAPRRDAQVRGSSRPTAPATTSTSSIRRPTRSSASSTGIEAGHGAGASRRTAAGSTSATKPRARSTSSTRKRSRHQEGSAERPPEQHGGQQRRPPRLRRDHPGAGRRRRHRHGVDAAREDHADQGHDSQRLRHARRQVRRRRLDRRQDDQRDRRRRPRSRRGRWRWTSASGRWRSTRTRTDRRSGSSRS